VAEPSDPLRCAALCRLEEIEDGEGKGFVLGEGTARREIVVIREGRRVYGYVNSCPHVGTPLELQPGRFMNADGSYILCHTHGALFEIESGRCIAGPCAGESLTPVALVLDEQQVVRLPR
jgi:nitrite reductase/ring-hydroxylating ferredoxin subunit